VNNYDRAGSSINNQLLPAVSGNVSSSRGRHIRTSTSITLDPELGFQVFPLEDPESPDTLHHSHVSHYPVPHHPITNPSWTELDLRATPLDSTPRKRVREGSPELDNEGKRPITHVRGDWGSGAISTGGTARGLETLVAEPPAGWQPDSPIDPNSQALPRGMSAVTSDVAVPRSPSKRLRVLAESPSQKSTNLLLRQLSGVVPIHETDWSHDMQPSNKHRESPGEFQPLAHVPAKTPNASLPSGVPARLEQESSQEQTLHSHEGMTDDNRPADEYPQEGGIPFSSTPESSAHIPGAEAEQGDQRPHAWGRDPMSTGHMPERPGPGGNYNDDTLHDTAGQPDVGRVDPGLIRQQSSTPEPEVYLVASYSNIGLAGDADIDEDLT
jgi:hypothetical protein